MATTLLKYSLAQKDMKQAKHTSQFAPIPRRKIICQPGVTTFFSLNENTIEVNGSVLKTPLSLQSKVRISPDSSSYGGKESHRTQSSSQRRTMSRRGSRRR